MMTVFGKTADGAPIGLYALSNGRLTVKVMTYGAIVTEIHAPDRDGQLGDVVLGFENLESYLAGHPHFGAATGRFAKNDRIDAEVLAHFADAIRPEPRPLPDAKARSLDALLARRRQLLDMLRMERNRLGTCADAAVRADLEAHVAYLLERLAGCDKELDFAVKASPAWREKEDLLRSIPGIGPVASRTLLAAQMSAVCA